jgi:hypothetical protein
VDVNAARVVTIGNIKTLLSPGGHTLNVLGADFRDLAGNTLGYQTASFEITTKSQGPAAIKVLDPIYPYKVMIEFDDEIQEGAYIRWIDGSKTNDSDKTTIDGKVASFEFLSGNKVIPLGGTTITIVNAKDYWGNAAQQPLSFTIAPTADTLRPAITGYGVDADGSIWIRFNKALDSASAKNLANYVIKNADGVQTYDWNIEYDTVKDDKKVILKSKGGDSAKTGKYKLTLRSIKDTVLPTANTIIEATIEVDIPDTAAPAIVSATWGWASGIPESSRRIIDIFYDKEVDYGSAMTRANYRTKSPGESYKALPNDALIGLQPGNRTVTLTFSTGFPAGNVEVSANGIQDLSGNRSNDAAVVANKTLVAVTKVMATGVRKVEMLLSGRISSFDPMDIKITNSSGAPISQLAVEDAVYIEDDLKIIVTLSRDLSKDAKYDGGDIYVYESISDVAKPASPALPVYLVGDGIAPTVSDYSYFKASSDYPMADGFSIYLIFDEQVKPHASAPDWNGVFPDIMIDGEVFVNGQKAKDDGYKIEWKIYPLEQAGGSGDWYLRMEFIANASGSPKLKGSDIAFTYNAYPGRTIQDASLNDIGSDGFGNIKFYGVRFGY